MHHTSTEVLLQTYSTQEQSNRCVTQTQYFNMLCNLIVYFNAVYFRVFHFLPAAILSNCMAAIKEKKSKLLYRKAVMLHQVTKNINFTNFCLADG